jgi:hypothetical protein
MVRQSDSRREEEYRRELAAETPPADAQQEDTKRRTSPFAIAARILMGLLAVTSVVLFFLTEDMRLSMMFADKWTIWMLIILLVTIAVIALDSFLSRRDEDDYEDDYGYDDAYDKPEDVRGGEGRTPSVTL